MVDVRHADLTGAELHNAKLALGSPPVDPTYLGQTFFDADVEVLWIATALPPASEWKAILNAKVILGNVAPTIETLQRQQFFFDEISNLLYIGCGEIETARWQLINAPGGGAIAPPQNWYVSPTGDDLNTGLSTVQAFLTIQKAVDSASAFNYPPDAYAQIHVAPGVYDEAVDLKPYTGGGSIEIRGNNDSGTYDSQMSGGNGYCFSLEYPNTSWYLRGLKMSSPFGGPLVRVYQGGKAEVYDCDLGVSNYARCLASGPGSKISVAECHLSDGSTSFLEVNLGAFGKIESTFYLDNVPIFTEAFLVASFGSIIASDANFSGTATGKRFNFRTNSVFQSRYGDLTELPGDLNGTLETGGQYA